MGAHWSLTVPRRLSSFAVLDSRFAEISIQFNPSQLRIVKMQGRFAFRQIDIRDLEMFLKDGEIRAKDHKNKQVCHQTSYDNLVGLRSTPAFNLPFGGVVNDYVAFYFSPLTGFTHTIHNGNVNVISPSGACLGKSRKEDRAFVVFGVPELFASGLNCCFSDAALNSQNKGATVSSVKSDLATHVEWKHFDDAPMVAQIPEIGYKGVCQYFGASVEAGREQRPQKRMAELLVQASVPMAMAKAIVLPSPASCATAQALALKYNFPGRVINNPNCFV